MEDSMWNAAVQELEAKNYERARVLLTPLIDNREAQLQLGYLYQEGLGGEVNTEKAREIYQHLANHGDAQGTYFLAKSFLNSNQLSEAIRYFEKSSKLSHVSGAFWAAALHGGLHGYTKDDEKYRFFLEHAASLGHIYAKRDLALADVQHAKTFFDWCVARWRHLEALAAGIVLTFRDRYDFRIR
jgi:TPR repeat protein